MKAADIEHMRRALRERALCAAIAEQQAHHWQLLASGTPDATLKGLYLAKASAAQFIAAEIRQLKG